MKYRFYKIEDNWLIDLKPWAKRYLWMLGMVAGADEVLENLAKGREEIILQVGESPIPFYDGVLERTDKLGFFKGAL